MKSILLKGNATAAPNIGSFKPPSLSFKGTIQIQSHSSPKSEHSGEVLNKIDMDKSHDAILVKRRINS